MCKRHSDLRRCGGTGAADQAVEIAMGADEYNVRSAKLKVDTLRWQASKLNPQEFGERVDVGLHLPTAGEEWLAALEALEADWTELRAADSGAQLNPARLLEPGEPQGE
ncbi:MAG: hypothetical protein VW405_05775 [Rhodospirillaceae bacterium]